MFGWGKKETQSPPEIAPAQRNQAEPFGNQDNPQEEMRGPQPGVPGGAAPLGWQTGSPAGVRVEAARYEVTAALRTDSGCLRESNEDSVRYTRPADAAALARKGVLAMVADGMGGHSGGEVASRIATDVINSVYYETDDDAAEALNNAFIQANQQIYKASLADKSLAGMGTTCVALVLQDGSAHCAYVGDSRLYLVRGGELYLMTEDHSAVMEMVHMGLITQEQARHHEDKNVIIRALGSQPEIEVSTWQEPFPVREGDKFLLCSDGLHDLVEDEDIKRVILAGDVDSSCDSLIRLAKERGGYDNVTVGILSIDKAGNSEPAIVRETREVEIPA
jgi:serine/threonine protein phosphatase PrpC